MKTAKYLATQGGWQKYEAPGDSAWLKQFVADKWKASAAVEHYADTYLPKSSVDLGPFVLLSAEDIKKGNHFWDDGELLSRFGLLLIGDTVGCEYLFMLADTGRVIILDRPEIPDSEHREYFYGSAKIEEFDFARWLSEEKGAATEEYPIGAGDFASFAEFDEALLDWHQQDFDGE
ncbi:MAG: hypothetical protein KJO21_11700 [Verrucomicrobiae bacterium]|nr:hypothetical protein [Verrucomicrobiae bacterium]NNJ43684.1 hypothetical protein [Akkermansiaceae bacterium]